MVTPAQSFLLDTLPATDAELLNDSRVATRNHCCVGLPVTTTELARMLAVLQSEGHCEKRGGEWFRTMPKPKEPKQKELF